MTEEKRITIKKEAEMRTKEISNMIDEGGLGAEKYYDIKKPKPSPKEKKTDDNK